MDNQHALAADALRALDKVRTVFPKALLTGGFLRDMVYQRTPKDIDIYIPHQEISVADMNAMAMMQMQGAAEYIEQSEIDSIWDMAGYLLPVQIIVLRPGLDPVDRAAHNDFSFCQIWADPDTMVMSPAFHAGLGTDTVTLVHCEDQTQFDRSMRRWDRLKLKYPEMTLVIPEEFRQYQGVVLA